MVMSRSGVHLKDKSAGRFLLSRPGVACFAAALVFTASTYAASATAAASGGVDVEIPLSELNKVKKEAPQKKSTGKSRTSKKIDGKSQDTAADAAAASQKTGQSKKSGDEAKNPPDNDKTPVDSTAASASEPENIKISHDPYSFVVADKNTLIHAVIYRDADELKSVTCRIRTSPKGEPSTVKMRKTNDSRFTYTATLPGVPPDMSSLSYAIVVVDSTGRESVSQEFVTPVKSSPVVPSWQN